MHDGAEDFIKCLEARDELRALVVRLIATESIPFQRSTMIADGVSIFHWGPDANRVEVHAEIRGRDASVIVMDRTNRVVGFSPGLVEWALERVKRRMILECLADA
ncbi:MAG: hypothetical protein AB7L09_01685 [Nitrospira sp.]